MAVERMVFIVIVNWNGRQVTLDCLASLREISYTNFKTVVVDNASADGSAMAIRAAFPEVVLLEMQRNLRFARGTNAGIRYALQQDAEMVLLLNNDTTVDREFLSYMVGRMQSNREIGMVTPKIYYHSDPDRVWYAGGKVSMWTGTMKHIGIREKDRGQFNAPMEIEYASGCCILTHREVIDRVGLLDESFYMYTEDADWSMRTRHFGYKIMYEPRAKVWHKLSVSAGGHLSWYKMKNKFLGNLRFFARYATWYQWLVFPWMNLLVNATAALRYMMTTRRT